MSNLKLAFLASVLLFGCTTPLFGQDGCIDSPENPTVVLAILGSAGAFYSTLRRRAKRNR